MKTWPVSLASLAVVVLSLWLQWALGPRWQDFLVQALAGSVALTLLLAFARTGAWPAFTAVFATLLLSDAYRLVRPPLPGSLVLMYTVMTVIALVVYLSVYEIQLKGLVQGFVELPDHPAARAYWRVLLGLAPLWFSGVVLARSFPELTPPTELRIVHPEPPNEISVRGKAFDMGAGVNPYRALKASDPARFQGLVAEGKKVYYQNCFYCHGDNLDGKGHFAAAFNPQPANFQDIGTIAMLQESFVYWRVAKGGPGLPKSGHPWSSAMPVWEDMLSDEEMWKAILYIYEGTEHEPRSFAAHGGKEH